MSLLTKLVTLLPAKLDRELQRKEADAKADIYEYCAKYDALPIFTHQLASRGNNVSRSQTKKMCQVIIEFPSQNIKVMARSTGIEATEILACIEFKKAAEQWHATNGESNLSVKDIFSLNLSNARQFFEFYRRSHRDQFEYVCKDISTKGSGHVLREGQIMMNGSALGDPVIFSKTATTEAAAWLSGAISLKKRHPELYPEFQQALREGNGEVMKKAPTIYVHVAPPAVSAMSNTLQLVRKSGLPKLLPQPSQYMDQQTSSTRYKKRVLTETEISQKNMTMRQQFDDYNHNESIATLRQKRRELPMNQYVGEVLELVNNNPFSIVVGATGSGKTTQVPQILLENAISKGEGARCNVICTQPRRIAATSVAQRVAVERNEKLQESVGYQVRFDSKLPQPGGSITFCTTGILLQQLRSSAEDTLEGISHILIDEVHERDIQIDLLLIILKRILKTREAQGKAPIKVVLMSATINTELFSTYFPVLESSGETTGCPSISVPGRTFPVKEYYLDHILQTLRTSYNSYEISNLNRPDTKEFLENERKFSMENSSAHAGANETGASEEVTIDWKKSNVVLEDGQVGVSTEKEDAIVPVDLIALTIAHIAKTTTTGAILVFLPGFQEIQAVDQALRSQPLGVNFNDNSKYCLEMLHSSIPQGQMEVFNTMEPGRRKVILSTNIAETSVTIADVQYVVDTGKMREKQYIQSRRLTRLLCTWVSKSNSKQRAGRAGRVQEGSYYALFTRNRAETLRATGLPEMLRSDLSEVCLDIKSRGFTEPLKGFLSEALEPPSEAAIDASLKILKQLEAMTIDEQLTHLGKVLSTL